MTRGGVRKGAGRPKKPARQTKTASLSGIRVTDSLLVCYRVAAINSGMTLTEWVQDSLADSLLEAADYSEEAEQDGPRDTKLMVDMIRDEAEASRSKK